jgi:hypothetical protein
MIYTAYWTESTGARGSLDILAKSEAEALQAIQEELASIKRFYGVTCTLIKLEPQF